MKRNSILRLAVVLVVPLATIIILSFSGMSKLAFRSAMQLKLNSLTKPAAPKVVLIGGSNLFFGINTPRLSDSLKMPVANLGLNYRLPLELFENMLRAELGEGDIVLAVLEYEYYTRKAAAFTEPTLMRVAVACPDMLDYFGDKHISVPAFHVFRAQQNLKALLSTQTVRTDSSGLNEAGDNTAHLDKRKKPLPKDGTTVLQAGKPSLSEDFLKNFRALEKLCDERNAKLLLLFPPIGKRAFNEVAAQKIHHAILAEKLPVIGKPEDNVYPDEDLFDTRYHLHTEGRKKATDKLIKVLKSMRKGRF